jgi:sulfur-carrier protein adenylyltransferase/sulfurtransferase
MANPGPGAFSPEEILRYSRHLILPEVGEAGQVRLRQGSVLLLGAGGLGSPMALYLAAAGVGRIGLVDFDRVEASNLQRQVLYKTSDVGRPKLEAARDRLAEANPHIEVTLHQERLTAVNALTILRDYDVIADGTDNFAARYLVSDACVLLGKPNVYGSVFRFEGQASVFDARVGPCYRCLFPEPPPPGTVPSCAEGGILGILPGVIGLIQATEAVKLLLGAGGSLIGRLLLYDAWKMEFRELRLARNPDCPACGNHPSILGLTDGEDACRPSGGGAAAGASVPEATESALPPLDPDRLDLSVEEVRLRRERGEELAFLDVREPFEVQLAAIEGARHIPIERIPQSLSELDPGETLIVYCHVGGRSRRVVRFLRAQGFPKTFNMQGGIDRWSQVVDPSLRRY